MYFDSWTAVLHMDGHGPYVWSAYAITALVVLALVLTPWQRSRQLRRSLQAEARRQALQEEHHAPKT